MSVLFLRWRGYRKRTCCPDAFFIIEKRYEVLITPYFYWSLTDEGLYDTEYSMITKCPSETLNTSKELCEIFSYENLKRLFPVTSIRSNYTYINQMCALCHDEDKSELARWHWSSRSQMVSMSPWSIWDLPFNLSSIIQKYIRSRLCSICSSWKYFATYLLWIFSKVQTGLMPKFYRSWHLASI